VTFANPEVGTITMRELLSHHSGSERRENASFLINKWLKKWHFRTPVRNAPQPFCARFVFGKKRSFVKKGLMLGTSISRSTQAQRCVSSRRPAATAWKSTRHAAGAKMPLFAPFLYKMHYFTKTGSGQTQGKLKKRGVFSQNQFTNYSQVCESGSLEPSTHKCTDLFTKTGSGQT
jgi:hypothetical protein